MSAPGTRTRGNGLCLGDGHTGSDGLEHLLGRVAAALLGRVGGRRGAHTVHLRTAVQPTKDTGSIPAGGKHLERL